MAFLAYRTSRGKKYWSIVESRRVNGKPRHIIIEYLGSAETLLKRLQEEGKLSLKSFAHGDVAALLNIADELGVIDIINKYVPPNKKGGKQKRDGFTVGASLVLAAIGRACRPTSKMGWFDWAKETSLKYHLGPDLKKLDSQHFWDQMNFLPEESIPDIETEIVGRLIKQYQVTPDTLLYDTSNFFTFIASDNEHCQIPQRGKNKQKRSDLRQIGLALLVDRRHQFPLFHQTYQGNENDITVFKTVFGDMVNRIRTVFDLVEDITLVFDKGNNSKNNFKMLDEQQDIYYVAGLVPSYFKDLIAEANQNFETTTIDGEDIPVYRVMKEVWGASRTCVVTVSQQLKEGQIKGIYQHLEQKYKKLEEFKRQLENPKSRMQSYSEEIRKRVSKIIKGQFIEDFLKYEIVKLENGKRSITYYVDAKAFEKLADEVLGRKILISNRHQWSSAEIICAYRTQAKVEYAFRKLKNPYHLAVRPQYHWTDQKIKVHILICVIGYLLASAAYAKAKNAGYQRNIDNLMEDLRSIRLACSTKHKSQKVQIQLEEIPRHLENIARIFKITNQQLALKMNFSDYS